MGLAEKGLMQINMVMPKGWKVELENMARVYSVEEGKTLTYLDLIRRAIKEKYELEGGDESI